MKRQFGTYRRLARGVFGASSVWLGPVDLLYVHGSGVVMPFYERYQRFELARIQSAAVVKTHTGRVLSLIYGVVTAAFGGLGVTGVVQAVDEGGPAATVYYVLAIPCAVVAILAMLLLIANVILGPTCHFQLQTATRLERVRAIRRLRTGRRVLAELAPVIAMAQPPADPPASPAPPAGVVPMAT